MERIIFTMLSYVLVVYLKTIAEEYLQNPSESPFLYLKEKMGVFQFKRDTTSTKSLPPPSSKERELEALLQAPNKESGLHDIGGMEATKRVLRECVVLPLSHPSILFGAQTPNGILLHGPPGTGKTLLAKSLASECNVMFLPLSASTLQDKWYGESEKLLSAAFMAARRNAHCILFMDEIDGLGRQRSQMDSSFVYTFKCELLRNMDSLKGEPVIVLACTNCLSSLDPALSRRFQRVIEVGRPNANERRDILKKLLKKEGEKMSSSLLTHLCDRTEGKTGADLYTLFQKACSVRGRERDAGIGIENGNIRTKADVKDFFGALKRRHWSSAMSESGF